MRKSWMFASGANGDEESFCDLYLFGPSEVVILMPRLISNDVFFAFCEFKTRNPHVDHVAAGRIGYAMVVLENQLLCNQ